MHYFRALNEAKRFFSARPRGADDLSICEVSVYWFFLLGMVPAETVAR